MKDDKEQQKAVIQELLNENAKLNAIIDGYQPRLQALKDEKDKYYQQTLDDEIQINELYEENERLKEEINEVKKYQYEQEYLDKEIEEMQKALKTLAKGLNKRQILLQEIKEIAERCNLCEECSGLDDCERECGDNVEPCSTYQMQIIVSKITKAEEE